MQKRILVALCCVGFLACRNNDSSIGSTTFEQEKWSVKDGEFYPNRQSMLPELLSRDTLKTLKKEGIIELLGEPDRIDNNHLFYNVARTEVFSLPMHTRSLVIKLKDDDSVEWVKIHE